MLVWDGKGIEAMDYRTEMQPRSKIQLRECWSAVAPRIWIAAFSALLILFTAIPSVRADDGPRPGCVSLSKMLGPTPIGHPLRDHYPFEFPPHPFAEKFGKGGLISTRFFFEGNNCPEGCRGVALSPNEDGSTRTTEIRIRTTYGFALSRFYWSTDLSNVQRVDGSVAYWWKMGLLFLNSDETQLLLFRDTYRAPRTVLAVKPRYDLKGEKIWARKSRLSKFAGVEIDEMGEKTQSQIGLDHENFRACLKGAGKVGDKAGRFVIR